MEWTRVWDIFRLRSKVDSICDLSAMISKANQHSTLISRCQSREALRMQFRNGLFNTLMLESLCIENDIKTCVVAIERGSRSVTDCSRRSDQS